MCDYKVDTSTIEGKLLFVAISRLQYLYKDKTRAEILHMLLDAVGQFEIAVHPHARGADCGKNTKNHPYIL